MLKKKDLMTEPEKNTGVSSINGSEAVQGQQYSQGYRNQANQNSQPRETVWVNADGTTTWSGGAGAVNPNKKYTEAEVYQGMAANNGGKAAVGQVNADDGQKDTPNYDWAAADYQSVLNDPNATGEQRMRALVQRKNKMDYMQNNDFQQLINDEMAKENPNLTMVSYWNQLRNQKLALQGDKKYNDSDYTQNFDSMYNDAVKRGDTTAAEQLLQDRQKKIQFFAANDLKALANEAEQNGDSVMADYYNQLHNQKADFLRNSDLQALINEAEQAGDKELAETYRRLREQKIQNGYGAANGMDSSEKNDSGVLSISDNPYENFENIYGEFARNNTNAGNEFDKASENLRKLSGAYEDTAESQYKYNEYKAQADADKNITAMYQKFYQEDLPAFKERIANYGLSAAGGLSRQENLMMQSALMAERNELETAKNETILQARMEADKLIAEGRMKEAEQVYQLTIERAKAITQEQQNNMNLALSLAELISEKQEKASDRTHDSEESQADRDFQMALQELKGNQEIFLERVKAELAEAKSENDLRRRIDELSAEYGFKGDQEKLISELRKEEIKYEKQLEN